MASPKVSPPMPQSTPQKYVQPSVLASACRSTPSRCGTVSAPSTQGATSHDTRPPTSQ